MSRVTAVFAHPDDETFICGGTLAKCTAEGHRVTLVCATRGEMGRRMGVPPTESRETLPVVRERELRDACAALGIDQLTLLGLRDKSLEIQPEQGLVDVVLEQLNRESPDVVITFHEALGGHPDHCTIGHVTTLAFDGYAREHPSARLYYVAWSSMEHTISQYGFGADQFVRIDVSGHLMAKLKAFRAHRTQSQLHAELWRDDKSSAKQLGSKEYFIAARGPSRRSPNGLV